jgi:hypothetical protein
VIRIFNFCKDTGKCEDVHAQTEEELTEPADPGVTMTLRFAGPKLGERGGVQGGVSSGSADTIEMRHYVTTYWVMSCYSESAAACKAEY